jgi:opacity protein-like surface antigen
MPLKEVLMRKLLFAAAAAATVLGGAMTAQTTQAQPYGYYERVTPDYHYDTYGRRYFEDRYGRHYVEDAAPRYDRDYDDEGLAVGGALLGSVLGDVPYDRYGPDPNGMIARDGHRIKCKLNDTWDYRLDRYVTRRVCD